jgi:hypothetical protein
MSSDTKRKRMISAGAAIFILLLWKAVSVGEDRSGKPLRRNDQVVQLQIRISEAKRKIDSIRYYKSAARHQKMGSGILPSSVRGATDGTLKRSTD